MAAVLDGLLALDDGDDPVFHNLVDPARVGIAGQSYGGWTTLTVLERDPRLQWPAMTPSTSRSAAEPGQLLPTGHGDGRRVLDAREP